MEKVVTRYAPSPTGNPHVGNIRTAIFAYLWAKHNSGKFLLRIEDTDRARFVPEAIKYIEESLSWLCIDWDGEKVFQSDRISVYKKYAEKLIEEGKAYRCYCSEERLEELRSEQTKRKLPPAYDRHCRNLNPNEIAKKDREKFVIRFAMPGSGKAIWNDLIRGKMEIDFDIQDDFIIMKSDGWPTYNFANVIDDHEMGITDIIRGEEFIPSTPKHLAVYDAFVWTPPRFSHMSHIIGKDRTKLSKRHGDTAILDYRDKGYLPEAMLNFLALLGWNDGTEKEIFSSKELIKSFDLKRVGKSPAVFDIEKLNWLNGQYIRQMPNDKLKMSILKLYPKLRISKHKYFDRILEVEKTRLVTLKDIDEETEFYLNIKKYDLKMLVFKKSNKEVTKTGLELTLSALHYYILEKWGKMEVKDFEKVLCEVVAKNNLTNGDVFWPVRFALSGKEKSPSPAELLWALGKQESEKRIAAALKTL